ncbi:Pectinesterase inhibitor domain [Sesbania bispinosa]|nr:Pectinesterase inhibitor domain [Sesbania bispinosa]
MAPASPFASVAPTEQSLIKKLCKDTRKPRLCAKIVKGDKGTLLAMNPVTKAKVSIDLATSIASRVGAYMSNQIQKNHVRLLAKSSVEGCKLNYENAVVQLNLAYINFENNPKKATLSLKKVNHKIGFCAKALKLAGSQADTLPIEETNKVIKGLVEVALPVVEKQAN